MWLRLVALSRNAKLNIKSVWAIGPHNVTGDLRASSGGGTVTYKNVRSNDGSILSPNKRQLVDASEATVLISNQGGKIKVDAAPEGADVYTGGGNIRVKGADRFVSAKNGWRRYRN